MAPVGPHPAMITSNVGPAGASPEGGGRPPASGNLARGDVALAHVVRRRLGGELQRVHGCCPSGAPWWRGAPGDTYVNRPTVTGRGAPTSTKRTWGLRPPAPIPPH